MNILNTSISITLQTVQRQVLSQNFVLSLSILTLNSRALFQKIEDEALSNPAILFLNRKSLKDSFESIEDLSAHSHQAFLVDDLLDDIRIKIKDSKFIPQKKMFLRKVLDEFLDENLFLNKDAFVQKYKSQKYYDWLSYFKRCEPVGIAASTLQERFKYQLEFEGLKNSLAYRIVDECWRFFLNRKFSRIQDLLKGSSEAIQTALVQIKKHCRQSILSQEHNEQSTFFKCPDLILHANGTLTLNESLLPKIMIDPKFEHMLKSTLDQKTRLHMKTYLQRAKNLFFAIQKRNETLLQIAQILLEFRKHTRIRLKEIALKTNLSQSTISRTLKNKLILTPDGIKPLEELKIMSNHLTSNQNRKTI